MDAELKDDKKNDINRTIALKISATNDDLDILKHRHSIVLKYQRMIYNELSCYGHDTIWVNNEEVDVVPQRKELYEQTNKSVPYDTFCKMLKTVHIMMANGNNQFSRSVYSLFLTLPNPSSIIPFTPELYASMDDLLENYTEMSSKDIYTYTKELLKAIKNSFIEMDFYRYNTTELSPPEKFIVMANVCRAYKTWNTWDLMNIAEYQQQIDDIEKDRPEFGKYEPLRDFCLENNITNRFNKKIYLYIMKCLIPAIQEGKSYDDMEHFTFVKTKKKKFSLNKSLYDYLSENTHLHDIPEDAFNWFQKISKHEYTKPRANFPLFKDDDFQRVDYIMGENYVNVKWEVNGPSISSFVTYDGHVYDDGYKLEHLFFKTSTTGTARFRVHTMDRYHNGTFNPSSYLKNATVWFSKDKPGNMVVRFTRTGKEITVCIKEPTIRKYSYGYAVECCYTMKNDFHKSDIAQTVHLYKSALPNNGKETDKNQLRFERLKGQSFNVLGVDYGQTNPFAYSVAEVTIDGNYQKPEISHTGLCEYDAPTRDMYRHFEYQIILGLKFFQLHTPFNDRHDNIEKIKTDMSKLLEETKEYFNNRANSYNQHNSELLSRFMEIESLPDHISTLIEKHNGDLLEVKKDEGWAGRWIHKFITRRFKEIKLSRQMNLENKQLNDFYWLKAIEKFPRLLKSMSYLGTDNNRTPITMDSFNKYFNNVKQNFMKQIASAIVRKALDYDCSVIAIEDLDLPSKDNTMSGKDMSLFTLWSPKMFLDKLVNASMIHNIRVVGVDPKFTSQVHYESGSFGYRNGEVLKYLTEDGIKQTHADINASKNILGRFASRHGDLNRIFVGNLTGWKKKSKEDGEDISSVRVKGKLSKDFGSLAIAKQFFKNEEALRGEPYVYIHKGHYVNKNIIEEEKRLIIDNDE